MAKPLRILYAAGPGNVIGTYRHWKEGRDDPSQISMTYSGQFYDLVQRLDAHAYVIATCPQPGKIKDPEFIIEHRPVPFEDSPGVLYHVGQFYWGIRLLFSALRYGANVAVVCAGTHWFMLWLLHLFGIKVVPTLHCVLWRKFNWHPTFFQRVVQKLNSWFFGGHCAAVISVSDEITQQVHELTGEKAPPVSEFVPQYRAESFDDIRPADPAQRPFRVLFVGRIERNKGVFDLLEIARRFREQGRHDIEFDLCGTGSALHELRQAIESTGLGERVRCHGHCDSETMSTMYSRSHVVIVPTTSDFSEGFNKVVAEGVLAGRPVITSSVCPALRTVRDAVVEVPPDDVAAYARAIVDLLDDVNLYESKRNACATARKQFYDTSKGWASALQAILASIDSRWTEPVGWMPKTVEKVS